MSPTNPGAVRTEILANVAPALTRVAVLEDGKLVELFVERVGHESLIGSIYKGRVSNIVPGMQAAFVDVGIGQDVFLPMEDIFTEDAATDQPAEGEPTEAPPRRRIADLLSVGQEILVQIVKEALGAKGPRGTTHLTLPGRFLVLMPHTDHLGISRRIEDSTERERLHALLSTLRPPGAGLIVRTEGQGKSEADFREDLENLQRLWDTIQLRSSRSAALSVLYKETDVLLMAARDLFGQGAEQFLIDSRAEVERLQENCDFLSSELKSRIRLYTDEIPLFTRYNVEAEIDRALGKKVWLRSGGTLIIEQTEALITIDVNSGRFVSGEDLEDTVYHTNLEASDAIARQVRLRNLAGIIIIDLIDMQVEEHKREVMARLKKAFARDRSKTNILELTELGLVQMTRQRHRGTLASVMKDVCPYCSGEGRVLRADIVAARLFREIVEKMARAKGDLLLVSAHPDVARLLLETREAALRELEARQGKRIFVRAEEGLHREQYRVEDGSGQ
ncbi:MAG: Rne/Rng family ribonuclease [Candidatus Riflebacteria bacterium]|nr:Rne/Rng family ribonuclease [Candidatus Riflebacteria bacterium]